MKKFWLVAIVVILLLVIYEVFSFTTNLTKPFLAPFQLLNSQISPSPQLWYQNISYLFASPKQMDVVLFKDQVGTQRVGIIETIISTETKNNRLYRIRLFLKGDGFGYVTVPELSIIGKVFSTKELASKIDFDKNYAHLVSLETMAPILQKIQKTISTTSSPLIWNKPQTDESHYLFFSVRDSDGYEILAKNVPFIEIATTSDLSTSSSLLQQIRQLVDKTITDNQFDLKNEPSSSFYPDFQSFQFTDNEYVCSGGTTRTPQIQLPYDDSKVFIDAMIDMSANYWSLKLACITIEEFNTLDKLGKTFLKDFGAEIGDSIYVESISGDFAWLHYKNLTIAHKINGHWKIIWQGNSRPGCLEMKRLSIPPDIYGACY